MKKFIVEHNGLKVRKPTVTLNRWIIMKYENHSENSCNLHPVLQAKCDEAYTQMTTRLNREAAIKPFHRQYSISSTFIIKKVKP